MRLESERRFLYQWEMNQRLIVEEDCTLVHFDNGTTTKALSVEVKEGFANIPNILLQVAADIRCYAWNGTSVVEHTVFSVVARPMPAEYVYTETEVQRYDILVQELEEKGAYYTPVLDTKGNLSWQKSLERMPDVPGCKIIGPQTEIEAGTAKFKTVSVETITGNIPKYLRVPHATKVINVPNVLKTDAECGKYGFKLNGKEDGLLIAKASNADIDKGTNQYKPIVPANLKYAVEKYTPKQIYDGEVGKKAWSSKNIVDKLCPAFTESGTVVICEPVEGYPLDVVSHITPIQEGSGYPSPDNIRPITGFTAGTLTHIGKNLFNGGAYKYIGSYTGKATWNNGVLHIYGYLASVYLPVQKNTTYAISFKSTRTGTKGGGIYLALINAEGQQSQAVYAPNALNGAYTFNTTDTTERIQVSFYGGEGANATTEADYWDIQLEIAPAATPYEPYQGQTFTADFGQTVYGGSLNWQTGVLTVTHFTDVIDGAEKKFTGFGKVGEQVYCSRRLRYSIVNNTDTLCSHLKYQEKDYSYGTYYVTDYGNDVMAVYIKAFADINEANTWLTEQAASGTPFTVCYQLAEPITIQLTPTEVLALSGVNYLYSDTGDMVVSGRAYPWAIIEAQQATISSILERIAALEAVAVNNI